MNKEKTKITSKIIAKIIVGVEKNADIVFENPTDPQLFKYVFANYKFMRKVIPSKYSDKEVVEHTINRIVMQYFLGMAPFNHQT